FFFFKAEDGIRDRNVTGVQTCALPILPNCLSVILTHYCLMNQQTFSTLKRLKHWKDCYRIMKERSLLFPMTGALSRQSPAVSLRSRKSLSTILPKHMTLMNRLTDKLLSQWKKICSYWKQK